MFLYTLPRLGNLCSRKGALGADRENTRSDLRNLGCEVMDTLQEPEGIPWQERSFHYLCMRTYIWIAVCISRFVGLV